MPQAPTVALPVRIPLGWSIDTRDATLDKDALLVNCYVDRDEVTGVMSIYRRPGFSLFKYETAWFSNPTDIGQGIYQGQFGFVYISVGKKTYRYTGPSTPSTSLISWGSDYPIYFEQVMGGKPGVVIGDLADTYLIDANNTVTGPFHTIDSDFPTVIGPGYSYLDGGLYVSTTTYTPSSSGAVIWGSALNSVDQPTSWDPLNFLTAQMTAEGGVYLTKQLGYVVLLKTASVEFFYDAGNATGSPLAPAENLFLPIGCANRLTVQKIGETLIWVTTTRDVSYKVVVMENTRPTIISTAPIERILNSVLINDAGVAPPAPPILSWHLITGGHTFYGLTLKAANVTLVYDLTEKMWYQWTDQAGNYLPVCSVTGGAGVPFLMQLETTDSGAPGAVYVWDYKYNADYIQEEIYGYGAFKGHSIPIMIRTPRWDGGTTRIKNLNAMYFVGDIIPGQIVTVQSSDDDYQTWSTPRNIDLGMDLPNLMNCGSFRRRAWKFTVDNFLPFRMQCFELPPDIGNL